MHTSAHEVVLEVVVGTGSDASLSRDVHVVKRSGSVGTDSHTRSVVFIACIRTSQHALSKGSVSEQFSSRIAGSNTRSIGYICILVGRTIGYTSVDAPICEQTRVVWTHFYAPASGLIVEVAAITGMHTCPEVRVRECAIRAYGDAGVIPGKK